MVTVLKVLLFFSVKRDFSVFQRGEAMPAKTTGQRILRVTFQIDDARGKLNDYQVVLLESAWP